MSLIDSHSHIYGERFEADREQVVQRAIAAGVTQLLQVGCNLEESRQVVALAESRPGIYASVGVHPHEASSLDQAVLDQLDALSHHPKVLSWGEIGLDYYYDSSPREVQREAFRQQLAAAARRALPIVVHTRDAEDDTRAILAEADLRRGGHVHCFTGTAALAQDLLALDLHIGFTGIITFKTAEELRQVVRLVPLERLLIETDSPYLAPIPHRGRRNEPAYVVHVAEAVAAVKDLDVATVIRVTGENFKRLYGPAGHTWESLS